MSLGGYGLGEGVPDLNMKGVRKEKKKKKKKEKKATVFCTFFHFSTLLYFDITQANQQCTHVHQKGNIGGFFIIITECKKDEVV